MSIRQSTTRRFRRGQWLDVEAGLFDLRNLGRVERVVVVADDYDHVLIEFRGQWHAILKGRGYIGPAFQPRLVDSTYPEAKDAHSRLFGRS